MRKQKRKAAVALIVMGWNPREVALVLGRSERWVRLVLSEAASVASEIVSLQRKYRESLEALDDEIFDR